MNRRGCPEILVVQLNMNGQLAVPLQLLDYCRKRGVEVLLLQEPPIESGRLQGFDFEGARVVMENGREKAYSAIVILNLEIEVLAIREISDGYFSVATVRKKGGKEITLVSAYFKYSVPIGYFIDRLGSILGKVGEEVLVGADVNAHSDLWHSRRGNNNGQARGTMLVNLVEEFELTVHNREGQPDTFDRQGIGSSNIDVTFSRGEGLVEAIYGWKVIDGVTDSDHWILDYKVRLGRVGSYNWVDEKVRYKVRRANWERFQEKLNQGVWDNRNRLEGDIETAAGALVEVIQAAMKSSMPKAGRVGRLKPPWWDRVLEESKRGLLAFR